MSKSASNQVIRLLPFFVGGLGGTLLFINRILTAQVTGSQSRSDALGVIEAAILILVGLLWQQIQAKTPETVDLIGETGLELDSELSEAAQIELAWASHLLLTNTVTRSLVVYYDHNKR
ncbi:MAG: cofactor assembly of complex C subunit B, partial [Cyanobacteria bacterium J06607_15]